MIKYKVAIVHNIISPYRIPLFKTLSNNESIELKVFYCACIHKERMWDIDKNNNYDYEVLSGSIVERCGIICHFNPSILSKLINGKYDAIIIGGHTDFTMMVSFIISQILKTPLILWSEGIASSNTILSKIIDPYTRYVIKNAEAIIVPGTLSREMHIKLGSREDKIFIAPNIVDNDAFTNYYNTFSPNREEIKHRLGIKGRSTILYMGRLIESKGINYLLIAYKMLKERLENINLVIVGDGPLREQLMDSCERDEIDGVIFPGWVQTIEQRSIYYSIADVFILPTLNDVWGLVLNEAMLFGLPVISTTAAGGSKDLIYPGENGYIIEPANIDQIYINIKKILINENLAKLMGRRSLEIINSSFTKDKMANGFIEAIKYAAR
jgi:glycosyltransferase involved in cell wall biosynthesis